MAMAEDCCQSHCQHAMIGEAAEDCCQSRHVQVSQALPFPPPAKTLVLAISALPIALVPPAVLQSLERPWERQSMEGQSPPYPPFYTLHCALLI